MNTWFLSDQQFHRLYDEALTAQASMHWTPLHIARKAAAFLAAEPGKKILDIGSGAGKFCLAAAHYQPSCFYYGIEQRKNLVSAANLAQQQTGLHNAEFIHANINEIDFGGYDHFYFFNAFYEHIEDANQIDKAIAFSKDLYAAYNRYLYKQLQKKPAGTRLATFHSSHDEIPPSYHTVNESDNSTLEFWVKI